MLASCAAVHDPVHAPESVEFTGTITWEGHFERPRATRTIPVVVQVLLVGDRARCDLFETWAADRQPEHTAFVRDDRGCWTVAPAMQRSEPDRGDGDRLTRILVGAARGKAHTIAWQHPRLGDVEDSGKWVTGEGEPELRVAWHRAHDHALLVLRRMPTLPAAPDTVSALAIGTAPEPASARPLAAARFATLAPGVHELVLPDASTRSLAIEFADHVVLCETSVDNHAGERLLAALDQHLPEKPVRYVLFGHYHPHYTGGLRPFLARGATVAAPPLAAAFAADIAARPFRSPPDRLAASGRAAVIETFQGQRTFRDDTNELVAIDIGAASHHTDEYVVFYLPRQRLLFQGDLGWFGGAASPRAGGDRARGLLRAIDERALDVETLVQGWPAHGRGTLPLRDLRALLAR